MEATPNALSFRFHNGVSASILVSKSNAGKFRVQSSDFDAMGFLVRELVQAIEA